MLTEYFLENLLFYVFAGLILFSAIMVISAKNPIHSILFLVLVFANGTSLLILLQAEFLAMLFLVVYVGAIAVLFLFVIMLLNIRIIELSENILRYLPIGSLITTVFLFEVYLIINHDLEPLLGTANNLHYISWKEEIDKVHNVQAIGEVIYTHYFHFFLVSGLVLLIAMIGAIVLTLHRNRSAKRQEIFEQVARHMDYAIRLKSTVPTK